MSAFERLGLKVRLVVSEEEIREAFRLRAAELHPDSGGDGTEFARLKEAKDILISPARRLREWMLVRGIGAEQRGQIAGGLMDLFRKVSEAGAAAEILIRKHAEAGSALVKAFTEVSLITQREEIKNLLEHVAAEVEQRVGLFAAVEAGTSDPAVIMRDLVFLEKWRATLRGIYGRLL